MLLSNFQGWSSSYSLGTLKYNGGTVTSASSWTKSGPNFTSANGNYGPGHNGFFTSPDGCVIWVCSDLFAANITLNSATTYLVYHATANSAGACDGNRYTNIQPLYFHSGTFFRLWVLLDGLTDRINLDGKTPNWGVPRALSDAIPAPV